MTATEIEVEPLNADELASLRMKKAREQLEQDAEKYLRKARALLEQVCAVLNDAKREGLTIAYGTADNESGEQIVSTLRATRNYELRN